MPILSKSPKAREPVAPKKSLFDSPSELGGSEDDQEEGGATLAGPSLQINQEYARRFEHNKKREERQRLEEKYKSRQTAGSDLEDDSSDSSEDETEDDEGFLVTEDLDAEISATLQAIKSKDPRIYDKNAVFYTPADPDATTQAKEKKEKPVTLRDYHRERYMRGDIGGDDDDDEPDVRPKTYVQEQEDLKNNLLSEIKATLGEDEEWSDDDTFLKPKTEPEDQELPGENGIHPSRAAAFKVTELDVANADKDPEEYLTKFMASRAWLPGESSKWQPFESDGEDDGDAAEEFEHAYNMRFEDPEKSNEVLKSYSRNVVAERSVRKDDLTGRKKQRQLEKEKKEAEKRERHEERARLRRLRVEDAAEKLAKIKQAAGMSGKSVKEEEWIKFLDDAWEDDKWEEAMKKQFSEEYYAETDPVENADEDSDGPQTTKKPKKPKWDDDIDIKDLVPDFNDESLPHITLTDSEPEGEDDQDSDDGRPTKKRKTSKAIKKDNINAKREARKERAKLEAFVDTKMELEDPRALASSSSAQPGGSQAAMPAFRYRETSPTSFGMTARDILLAPDAALNEYAGLKKLATFRDVDKKRRDKKRLGKKARLREWRRETFGKEFETTGPTFGFESLGGGAAQDAAEREDSGEDKRSKKKRKRSKTKNKTATET